jgi:tRNA-specific 2-thiouridylase
LNQAGKVLIAMSGGVDSSTAAALLLEKGCECLGVTLKLCAGEASGGMDEAELNDARQAAEKLGLPHFFLDFSEDFREKVILRFIESYEKGLTPNPCVECNRYIKFGRLFSEAGNLDCSSFATGHYAKVEKSGSRWLLKKAVDIKKDQSYVLFCLGQETLARTCFPLGELTKNEVREIAYTRKLVNVKRKESQDICFVPNGDYGVFMEAYTGKRYPHGDILDPAGRTIGRHRGIVRYTLGQRRGLGVALNEPLYVCAKDTERNTVTLGPESSLYSKALTAGRINLIACENLEKPMKLMVKTRYLQTERPALAQQTGVDEIRVEFDEAQRAITPGQAAVLYDGDIVVGGGIIKSAES